MEQSKKRYQVKSNVESWTTATSQNTEADFADIMEFHLVDSDDPNLVISYSYGGDDTTYTVTVKATTATTLIIDSLPISGYTVIITDGTTSTTLTSSSDVTRISIAAYPSS